MSHGSGLYALAHVIQGSCHVIPGSSSFDPAEIFELIEYWPNVAFFAAPTMVKRLVMYPCSRDVTNLKVIIYGGGPMYVDDLHAGLNRFGPRFAQLYGQGESPMTISAMSAEVHADKDHPRWLERLESVGFPQTAVEVKIASEDGTHLPAGEVGEIIVRGDTIMNGYWQDPAATAQAIRDGWLFTGDYGVFDRDGFLTLKGRAKDVIISGGTNIYPREVEEVLVGHPSVSEASVIGRADRDWGEAVVAYIVPAECQTFDEESIEEYCLDNMARFKRPKYYRSVVSLPKNNYGKVLKTELRELETSNYGGE
jgi:long-chain acyl-CoA synthetase